MAERSEKDRSLGWFSWLLTAVVALPLAYILSAGPAIILCEKVPSCERPIGAIYIPLVWAGDHTPLKKPMYAYFNFWVRVAGKI